VRILFGLGQSYIPQHFGGIPACIDNLSRGLVARGHDVSVLSALAPGDLIWLRNRALGRIFGFGRTREKFNGYSLFREWGNNIDGAVDSLIELLSPDVFVGHGGYLLERLFTPRAMAKPVAAHFHGTPPIDHANYLHEKGVRNYIFCSLFLQSRFLERVACGDHDNLAVIYNAFDPNRYRVSAIGDRVTFINPNSMKGVDIALALAEAFPEIPFLFVKGWGKIPDEGSSIEGRVRSLPNVTISESTAEMRAIYRRTRILIVPSQVEEGAGRVITEAQISGIPVLASELGGIPEVLGDGGVVLPHNDIVLWIETLREVWQNSAVWRNLSEQAQAQAARAKFSYETVLDEYETFLSACIARV